MTQAIEFMIKSLLIYWICNFRHFLLYKMNLIRRVKSFPKEAHYTQSSFGSSLVTHRPRTCFALFYLEHSHVFLKLPTGSFGERIVQMFHSSAWLKKRRMGISGSVSLPVDV